MLELELAFSSFIIGLSGAMMPGPLLTYVINGSLQKGFIAGPLIITGHAILELILVILLLSGMSRLFASPLFAAVIGIVGGLVLILMAADMINSALKKKISFEKALNKKADGEEKLRGLIIPGALVSIANPYWTIWWATIGMTYLANASQHGNTAAASFFMGHISADFAWYALIAFFISKGRKFLNDNLYRKLIIIFSLLLIYFGASFLIDSIQYFS
ncbi:LysE family translocator [Halanaerobium sp. Z-7514]|uniref:LysE family translocator n=1 Tax=Halanaerobium polyolivorans TaxID=2886943 RepID=A0AAW4WZQ8_9FIRM|nr:LysE family transporter [Halanaerobium polyolivorans]MCC3145155.1 LysE family translocator [Halanaerobium polyolivorans]RQD76182.1 MAG: lysine transporter LysE [Halanaerobium sp. MSAO_Bac5]